MTEFYYKWNGEPPEGWLANYCKCGSFDPQTPDLGELKTPNLHYKLPEVYRPTNIFIEEIWKIEIMSNNMLRFVMDDYYTYNEGIYSYIKFGDEEGDTPFDGYWNFANDQYYLNLQQVSLCLSDNF